MKSTNLEILILACSVTSCYSLYGYLFGNALPVAPANMHYETIDQINRNRNPGSYQIMSLGDALLSGRFQISSPRSVDTKPSPTNKLKKLASSKKPDVLSTGLDLIEDLGPYAPLMFKVGSMFVPGLNNYQIIMMAAKAASLTAKAIKDLKNGDSVSEVGKNVLYDSLKVALSKREFGIESVGNAVKKPYLSVKNWLTGSNSGEHKEKSQNDNDGANKNEIATKNKTRLDKMSGEEFLERLTLIQDKLPNPKSVDIENGFEKLVEALDLDPNVSKETKNSLIKALSITTRFFIARAMQPTIISML